MGGVACLEAVNTAVKWLRGATHIVSLAVSKGVASPIVNQDRVTVDVEAHRRPWFLIGRGTEGRWVLESAVEEPIEVRWRTRPRARVPERHKWNDGQYKKGIS
jgi:formyltetrahydrofolate hydrolase